MIHHHVFSNGHRCRFYMCDAGRIQCTHGFADSINTAPFAPNPTRERYDSEAHRALRLAASGQVVHTRSALRHRTRELGPHELEALRRMHNRGYLDRAHPPAARDHDGQHVIAPTELGLALLAHFAQHHTIIPTVPSTV